MTKIGGEIWELRPASDRMLFRRGRETAISSKNDENTIGGWGN